jgi:alpha-mannosidase
VSDPDVLLWALKPAEDGIARRLTVRLWNLSSRSASPTIRFGTASIRSAKQATHVEVETRSAPATANALNGSLAKWQIGTFLLALDPLPLIGGGIRP